MKRWIGRMGVFALSVLAGCGILLSKAQAEGRASPLATGLSQDFVSDTATVNGTTLHYVRGGKGPPLILIHGFPQDWMWSVATAFKRSVTQVKGARLSSRARSDSD